MGLERGDVTGNHDMSHNLQLLYSDVFKHEKTGDKKIIKDILESMAHHNSGEGGTVFHETAMRMSRTELRNKKKEDKLGLSWAKLSQSWG